MFTNCFRRSIVAGMICCTICRMSSLTVIIHFLSQKNNSGFLSIVPPDSYHLSMFSQFEKAGLALACQPFLACFPSPACNAAWRVDEPAPSALRHINAGVESDRGLFLTASAHCAL